MASPKLDGILLRILRDKRSELARHSSQFQVCHDVSIEEMATYKPKTIEELVKIKGIKKVKAEQYGREFLAVIAKRPELTYERIYTDWELMGIHNSAILEHYRAANDDEKLAAFEKMKKCLEYKTKFLGECQSTRNSRSVINDWTEGAAVMHP